MQLLQHKNPFVRQAVRGALHIPRVIQLYASEGSPVIANSVPKSGTHLLDQIVAALPGTARYGRFLSSMTSSFRFHERTPDETVSFIESLAPCELLRAHLFHDERYATALQEQEALHFFIYRDPRDVVVSEAFYLRDMNRWHKLHRYYRDKSDEEILLMTINGIQNEHLGDSFPDIGTRFSKYVGWLREPGTFAVRFEDLTSDRREDLVHQMVEAYSLRSEADDHDLDEVRRQALAAIRPEKSHTYRKGRSGGWRDAFTTRCRDDFQRVAGDLLVELNYADQNES